MIDQLSSQIWARDAFQREFSELTIAGISQSLGVSPSITSELSDVVVPRLLECASHFAASTRWEHRAAAYRIAIAAWQIAPRELSNLRQVVHFVLGRLGNFPAAQHLLATTHGTDFDNLPIPLMNEIESRAFGNSVSVAAQRSITLTDFQRLLWDTLTAGETTAITAPTSAGKSFVLQHYLVSTILGRMEMQYTERLRLGFQTGAWGLYVVPTRALITQVSVALGELSSQLAIANDRVGIPVVTIPIPPSQIGVDQGLYVLTQERLQTLFESGEEINFEVAVIDEAQGIADGARGVVLQTVIEQLRRRSPNIQLLFGSPQTRNPEIFQEMFNLERLTTMKELESPVAQSLILASTDTRRRNIVKLAALVDSTQFNIGEVDAGINLSPGQPQALATIAWTLGRNQRNLVYAGGPAACEELADMLSQLAAVPSLAAGTSDETTAIHSRQARLQELSDYLAEHIHPKYLLVSTVLNGIAFHYGNMPAAVRRAIEDYFADGLFSHLVSTSTLLAGVNLPARNLFLQKPTKGQEGGRSRGVPISSIEFWNLAGRAGRLGKDFEGRIFLVDLDRWEENPLEGARDQEIEPALDSAVMARAQSFLEFVRDVNHRSGSDSASENTFVKLVNEARRGTLRSTLDRVFHGAQPGIRDGIQEAIETAAASIRVPVDVAERNIYVSVYRQDDLLSYFERKINEDGPESVIPLHPLAGEGVYQNLLAVFGRISRQLEKVTHQGYVYYARLARLWMLGQSLRDLIQDAYEYRLQKRRSNREPSIASVIRTVMSDVEQHLRFRYVKYTSCYNDLLRYALVSTGNEDAVKQLPSLPLYLELGASSNTMVSLIGLGLTRTTAGILAKRSVNSDLGRIDAARWLRAQNLEGSGMPSLVLREVSETLRQMP